MRKRFACAIVLSFALISIGCQQAPPPAPKPDLKAEAAKIRELDDAWMKSYKGRDAARHASFFAEDGSWYLSGYPKATGRQAITKLGETLMKTETSASWTTPTVWVSEAADFAFSAGTWEAFSKDANGKPMKQVGKFVTFWKKQGDGSWMVLADSPNPDGPRQPVK